MPTIDYRSPIHAHADAAADMRHLAISDASALPRLGLKGPAAVTWLESQGITVPPAIYDVGRLESGALILRLGTSDFLLEGAVVARLSEQLGYGKDGVYRVERQDASFLLMGARAAEVLAQMCSIDFRSAPAGRVCMTRAAGVNCTILPEPRDGIPTFRFWVDYTLAESMWESLEQISGELGGHVVSA